MTLFGVLSLITGCCAVALLYPLLKSEEILDPQPAPEQVSDAFLAALAAEDYQTAYDLCDGLLQAELVDAANLRAEIEKEQLKPARWEVISRSLSSGEAEYTGSMDFQIHISGTFRIMLRQYDEGWRVSVFFMDY